MLIFDIKRVKFKWQAIQVLTAENMIKSVIDIL